MSKLNKSPKWQKKPNKSGVWCVYDGESFVLTLIFLGKDQKPPVKYDSETDYPHARVTGEIQNDSSWKWLYLGWD